MGIMVGGKAAQETQGGDRELPPEGRYNAVCCDVHLYEQVKRKAFNGAEEVRDEVVLVWALGTKEGQFLHNTYEKDGQQVQGYVVTVRQPYRPSLNEKANLRKLLDSWLGMGKKYGADWPKTQNIELERLLGHPAEAKVEHTKDGKYLNLVWAEPLPEGYMRLPLPPSGDTGYTRIKDREQKQGQAQPAGTPAGGVAPSEDPFGPGAQQPQGGGYDYPAGPPKMDGDPF